MSERREASLWKNMFMLIILMTGGALIYMLPYLRGYYYIPLMEALNFNNTQIGNMAGVYGTTCIICYFFGGWLADRVSARKLLTISFVLTGLGGFYLATYPSYNMVLLLHVYWGITTILTFWAAFIKATRQLAAMSEQGKAFGFLEGGRGITYAIIMSIALAVFAKMGSGIKALNAVIYFYSILVILIGIVSWFVFKDDNDNVRTGSSLQDIVTVIKMPKVWLIALIIFCSYAAIIAHQYIAPFTTQVWGGSVVLGAIMAIMASYVRPVAAIGAGFLGDKVGSSKIILYGFILLLAGVLGLVFIPASRGLIYILVINLVVYYLAMYVVQGLHYALLEEGDIPLAISGTAIGVISTFGYFPEVLVPMLAGRLLDKFPGALGYKYFFGVLAVLLVVGFFITLYWMGVTKKKRLLILEAAAAQKAQAN
ncbi:MAG TPA: MFS transporter [Syntrophomonadaceae bacterium]|nr:MFS transporter [Syntrophomonadaceae bacterium]